MLILSFPFLLEEACTCPICACIIAHHHTRFPFLFLSVLFFEFLPINLFILIVPTGEKKKTKAVDNELNPVWNEVSGELKLQLELQYVDLFIWR